MRKILKHFKTILLFLMYKTEKKNESIAYYHAQEKGMYCEGIRNGIAKFDPNRPPQDKPMEIGYREFYKRINRG